jgi:hypothetical protein
LTIVKTALPANIEDEDLIDGQPLVPKPISVRTKMSYQLARIKFAEFSKFGRRTTPQTRHIHSCQSAVLPHESATRLAELTFSLNSASLSIHIAKTSTDHLLGLT